MRRAAREIVERGRGSLKADRGAALYVTDVQIKSPGLADQIRAELEQAGFLIQPRGPLWGLTPDPVWHARMEEAMNHQASGPLSCGLHPLREREILPEEQALWIECVKALELNRPTGALERSVREQAARCLRLKRGGGLLYACARIIEGRKEI